MNIVLALGVAIAAASIWGAAYLLALWHEDRAGLIASGVTVSAWRTWTLSRVLAYLAVACTLASNYLIFPTALRIVAYDRYREIIAALTPFTVAALLVLDMAFVILALYLRAIRRRRRLVGRIGPGRRAIPVDEGEEAYGGDVPDDAEN